jgi:hypothetical protein
MQSPFRKHRDGNLLIPVVAAEIATTSWIVTRNLSIFHPDALESSTTRYLTRSRRRFQ